MGRRVAGPVDSQLLVAQLGREVATRLSSALARVTTLATTGKIDRAGLRALRDEIDHARRAGIMGQQVVRLSSGQVQISNERLDLTGLLSDALQQRGREIDSRGIEVRRALSAAEVMSDATLVFSLLQTLLDWCLEHAFARIDLAVEVKSWPAHACLSADFQHDPPDKVEVLASKPSPLHEARLDTMSWQLLQQTADTLGLDLVRSDTPGKTRMVLLFPQTLAPRLVASGAVDSAVRTERAAGQGHNSLPLADRHVVVLASRRELRSLVRTALRPTGLMVDIVTSLEEFRQLVADGLPHAVVYEAQIAGEAFERLRGQMLAEMPTLVFIRIADQGQAYGVLTVGGRRLTSVGRDAIMVTLPEALRWELSRAEGAAAGHGRQGGAATIPWGGPLT